MTGDFPSPTASRAGVFLGHLDYFRATNACNVDSFSACEQRRSQRRSGLPALELVKQLDFIGRLEEGFEGKRIGESLGAVSETAASTPRCRG